MEVVHNKSRSGASTPGGRLTRSGNTKMRFTRRQIATVSSVVFLAVLTGLAIYALQQSQTLSLPIPQTLTSFTLALPAVAGLAIETSTALALSVSRSRKYARRHASNFPAVLLPSTLTILILIVYTAVIATLAGTHISPVAGLKCALRERWQKLYSHKEGPMLREIQDAFRCCGLANTRDMSWPFPSGKNGVGVDACVQLNPDRVGRACAALWMGRERVVAGCLLAVAVGTFAWMATIIAIPAIHPSWARESLRLPPLEDGTTSTPRNRLHNLEDDNGDDDLEEDEDEDEAPRVIEYEPYTDDPSETEETRQDRRREIESLNNETRLAVHVEGSRVHPSRLMREMRGSSAWDE